MLLQDKQLPMLVSTFWSIIQKCSQANEEGAAGVVLDVKRSSHKKVSVFLDVMASSSDNKDHPPLLCLQSINGVASVVAVQRVHDWLRGRSNNPYQSNSVIK